MDVPPTFVHALQRTVKRYGNDRGVRDYATLDSSKYIGYADIECNARAFAASLVADEALAESTDDRSALAHKVKDALTTKVSLPSLAVGTLELNHLPRTSSGKVRRGPTRLAVQSGLLPVTFPIGFTPTITRD